MRTDSSTDHHRSEPITSARSKALIGDDLNLHPISELDCQTQNTDQACEISTLDGEDKPPETIHVVPIHRRPDLLVPCADLLNAEWQRSQAARVHSLQKSCPEFPVCLVLLQGHGEGQRLLGHARLSRVVGHGGGLFLESVVVSKAERGKGYGRTLMDETERYAKKRGFKRLYLTTHDKQHFYAHLGYVLSTPVQNAGAMTSFVPMEMLLRFSRMPSEPSSMWDQTKAKMEAPKPQRNKNSGVRDVEPLPSPSSLPPPPPPPPPLPPPPPPPTSSNLTPPPPPPPPPPPTSSNLTPPSIPSPPPPPQCMGQLLVQTLTQTPYRDAKGVAVYWMHKDI